MVIFIKSWSGEQQSVDKTYITEKIVELKNQPGDITKFNQAWTKAGEFNNVDIKFLMSTLMGTVNHVLTTWQHLSWTDDQSGVEEKHIKIICTLKNLSNISNQYSKSYWHMNKLKYIFIL